MNVVKLKKRNPHRKVEASELLKHVYEVSEYNKYLVEQFDKLSKNFAAQMEGWLEVQNQHKIWTQGKVNDLFQREQKRLSKLTDDASRMLEANNLAAEQRFVDAAKFLTREQRHKLLEALKDG